jgi:hypothetical protein
MEDERLKEIRQLIKENKTSHLTKDDHGTLLLGVWICVPNLKSIQELILRKAHDSSYSIHPGSTNMYQDLKTIYWWYHVKRDITEYVSLCDTCQRVKAEHQGLAGLLQPLKIPEWQWEEIRMDFIVGLPCTQAGYDSILVIVDRLTKAAHFIPVKMTYSIATLAEYICHGLCVCTEYLSRLCRIEDPNLHLNFGRSFTNRWTLSSISAQHIIRRLSVKQRGPTRY